MEWRTYVDQALSVQWVFKINKMMQELVEQQQKNPKQIDGRK